MSGPINSDFIKQQIDNVRGWIGRDVTVYTPHTTACSLCQPSGYYDQYNDSTFYTLCPVCQGSYWINTPSGHTVLARVHWAGDEAITATPGGKYFVGDATITVDPSYLGLMEEAQSEKGKVVVDGHDMQITAIRPEGAPTLNRYKIVLKGTGERPS